MNKKSSNFVKKWAKFQTKAQKCSKVHLSGRFGALTGKSGDLMKNLETPGKTGRVGRYGFGALDRWSHMEVQLYSNRVNHLSRRCD